MTTIPNAVTNDQLLSAMQQAIEPEPVLFAGKTLDELQDYLYATSPKYNEFGDDAAVINKINILNELVLLHQYHERMVEHYKQHEETEEVAQAWARDAGKVLMLIHALKGVELGNKDPFYTEPSVVTTFMGELTSESLEVVEHFGIEAPALLNKYSCAVEDALIEQVEKNNELRKEIARLKGEPEPELMNTKVANNEMAGKIKDMLKITAK